MKHYSWTLPRASHGRKARSTTAPPTPRPVAAEAVPAPVDAAAEGEQPPGQSGEVQQQEELLGEQGEPDDRQLRKEGVHTHITRSRPTKAPYLLSVRL